MVDLPDLLLPIFVAAVGVFIASSVIHMATPMHKGDFRKLANEDAVMEALHAHGVTPGDYGFPCPSSMKEMGSPEMVAKYQKGPVGWLTVLPSGVPNIGKSLGQWFVFCLVVGLFVAYVAKLALPAGAAYFDVFRITGATATLGYGISQLTNSIWKGVAWSTTAKFVVDGVVYGLVTAGVFGAMWPVAA